MLQIEIGRLKNVLLLPSIATWTNCPGCISGISSSIVQSCSNAKFFDTFSHFTTFKSSIFFIASILQTRNLAK